MPSTIPYDPSLVLGNIVHQERLDNLTAISALQAPVDAAEDTLNSFISMKRSIDMTIQELINMQIDTTELIKESAEVGKKIQESAIVYAKAKLDAETKMQPLRAKIIGVHDDIESPIDYNKTDIKKMQLSADSLKMNVQYFAFDENQQSSDTHAATIKSFVSEEVSYMGESYQSQASSAVQAQMNSQHSRHSISGTLVISVTCTHRDASLLAPFILDVDKAVRVWNRVYKSDMIKTDSITNMAQIAAQSGTEKEKSLTILSGATYGSCFIGMVHILDTTDTRSSEAMYSVAASLQTQFKVGNWLAKASGGMGVDSSFSNDAKNLLSSQNVTSHCTLVAMGSIPSIKSNTVQMGVKGFADDDGAKSMAAVQKLQNATATENDSVDSSAEAARTGGQLVAMKSSQISATLSALSDIDKQSNKVIDTNSMMDALEDYINKCLQGNVGVPINYYLKPITKSQIAQMWMTKYYPGQYLAISGDDSAPANNNAPKS
ncbi:hypothetical protein ACFQ21_04210 [Ohtaekwangia kribbensis]|jgi:hypothetical protein|uniref:Uncharacterized protein n=1 Tax=Ohtaekwangia kribbensis TaxID=688913 RepID=A0ABW3JWX1_9BACT